MRFLIIFMLFLGFAANAEVNLLTLSDHARSQLCASLLARADAPFRLPNDELAVASLLDQLMLLDIPTLTGRGRKLPGLLNPKLQNFISLSLRYLKDQNPSAEIVELFQNLSKSSFEKQILEIHQNEWLSAGVVRELSKYAWSQIAKIPAPVIRAVLLAGRKLTLIYGPITDHPELEELRGQRLSEEYLPFEEFPGAAHRVWRGRAVVNGHFLSGLSRNTILHELFHLYDLSGVTDDRSSDPHFLSVWRQTHWSGSDYWLEDNRREAFAEGSTRFYYSTLSRLELREVYPLIYDYFDQSMNMTAGQSVVLRRY